MKGSPSSQKSFKSLIPPNDLTLPILYFRFIEYGNTTKFYEEQLGSDSAKFELLKEYAKQVFMALGNDREKLAQFKEYVNSLQAAEFRMKDALSSHQDFKKLIPKDNLFLPLLYVQYSEHKDPSKIFEQLGNDERKFEIFKKYARKILMVLGNNPEKLAQFKAYVQELARNNKQNYASLPLSAFSEEEKALFFPIVDKLLDEEIEPSDVFNLLNRDKELLERFKAFFPSVGAARKQYQELLEKERQSQERLHGLQAEHERLQQNITYNYQIINKARNDAATNIARNLGGVSTPTTTNSKARIL